VGPGAGGRPAAPRPALLAEALTASSVAEIERELDALRSSSEAALRTSSLTHIAWIPPEWEPYAREVMATLGERHPSRVLLLFPQPDAGEDGIEAKPNVECFRAGATRLVCAEVVDIRLLGAVARAPASVVLPLLVSDLPVFLRWRGRPTFDDEAFRQLSGVADRIVFDTSEWEDVPAAYAELAQLFSDHLAVSDIAWARGRPWRGRLAMLWPSIAGAGRLRVRGPQAESLLLHAWLVSRLGHEIELDHEPAPEIEAVEVDGEPVQAPRWSRNSAADLLSDQLDLFGRDRVYEEAVRAATR
jgi:glucose-6-phosphate dehydrogenase assembly protein OpcA